jgi:hypothetical protein
MEDERRASLAYTELGIVAVACGVIGLVVFVLTFVLALEVLLWVVLVLGVLAILFGIFAYWGLERDTLGLAGFSLGTLLVILWFLFYAYASVRGL